MRLEVQGNLKPLRDVRGAYAGMRANERAEARGEAPTYKPDAAEKAADREARRTIAGTGRPSTAARSTGLTTRGSTRWPRPTSPMARPSRSSG